MDKLLIKKLDDKAIIPCLGSEHSAGLDLATLEPADIPAGQRVLLRTGLAFSIPSGMAGFIWPRSKLANKHGLIVLGGLVDSDYRGEVMISLLNTSSGCVELRAGDRVAQMVIQHHMSWLPIEEVQELDDTERGKSGINSHELRLR